MHGSQYSSSAVYVTVKVPYDDFEGPPDVEDGWQLLRELSKITFHAYDFCPWDSNLCLGISW